MQQRSFKASCKKKIGFPYQDYCYLGENDAGYDTVKIIKISE